VRQSDARAKCWISLLATQSVGGIAMPLPLYGQSLFGQRARAPIVPRQGQTDLKWFKQSVVVRHAFVPSKSNVLLEGVNNVQRDWGHNQ